MQFCPACGALLKPKNQPYGTILLTCIECDYEEITDIDPEEYAVPAVKTRKQHSVTECRYPPDEVNLICVPDPLNVQYDIVDNNDEEQGEVACPFCGLSYKYPEALEKHLQNAHS